MSSRRKGVLQEIWFWPAADFSQVTFRLGGRGVAYAQAHAHYAEVLIAFFVDSQANRDRAVGEDFAQSQAGSLG
jgi:hypothetical protein